MYGAGAGSYSVKRTTNITPEQQTQYNNLLKALGSPEAVANYMNNSKKTGIVNSYLRYNNTLAKDKTETVKNNLASRTIYDVETGKIIKGVDLYNMINSKGTDNKAADFTVVGRPSANNTYFDLTGNDVFTKPYVGVLNGKHYMIGMSQDERVAEGMANGLYNKITQSYRSGMPSFIKNNNNNKTYKIQYTTQSGQGAYMVYDGNNGLGTIIDNGGTDPNLTQEQSLALQFDNLINSK